MERGNQNWLYNCEYVMEVPMDQTKVPHFLPGTNPFQEEFSKKFGLPLAGVWGGAESTYPEYMTKLAADTPATTLAERPAVAAACQTKSTVRSRRFTFRAMSTCSSEPERTSPFRSVMKVFWWWTPECATMRDKVLAAIRKLSTKPIRWIINTSADADHTSGNETVSQAGQTVNGNPAEIIAHEGVLARMTELSRPITERPLNTYFEAVAGLLLQRRGHLAVPLRRAYQRGLHCLLPWL